MTKEDYLKRIKSNKNKNYRESIIKRTLLSVIFILIILIISNLSDKFKSLVKNELLENTFNFSKINALYKKYVTKINPIKPKGDDTSLVSSAHGLNYSKSEDYLDGVKLTVDSEYPVKMLDSGLVVYIGEKEGYGSSVVVKQSNGIDVIYGNITDTNIKVYDYIEKGTIIGNANEYLYLVFQKEGEILDYKKYI